MNLQWATCCVAILAIGGILSMAEAQPASGPASRAAKFTVGPETTFVIGPLNPDGTVNYVAAWNEKNGQGVTAENNAAVLIARAIGPKAIWNDKLRGPLLKAMGLADLPEEGEYLVSMPEGSDRTPEASAKFFDHMTWAATRPVSKAEAPEIGDWLKQNEKPLASIVAASKRSKYFVPWVSSEKPPTMADGLGRLSMGLVRTAVRALAARAVDRADKGDIDGAKEDLLAIHRLAQLLCQEKTFIAYLVAITLDSTASRTEQGIAANVKLTALQARSLLSQTYGLGPMPLPVDAYDWGERLIVLDAAMLIAREGYEGYLRRVERDMGVIFEKAFPASSTSRETVELPKFDLDIDEYLRAMNEGCDEVVRCAKLKDFAACTAAFAEMDKDKMPEAREAEKAFPGMASGQVDPLLARKRVKLLVEKIGTGDPKKLARALVGFDLWEWMEGSHSGRVFELGVEARAQHALSVISLAMAAYRAEKGEYPDSLDKLAPTCLKTIPLDPFTDKPMRYKRTDKGYVLYSVGPNMRDDGGVRDYAASAPADRKDDISVNNEK